MLDVRARGRATSSPPSGPASTCIVSPSASGSPIPWLTCTPRRDRVLDLLAAARRLREDGEPGGGRRPAAALEGGEVEPPVPPDRVFEAKPVWKRMVVILAGVTMNALFAWLVFVVPRLQERPAGRSDDHGRPGDGRAGAAAAARRCAHPASGTRIAAINGRPVAPWNEIAARHRQRAGRSEVRLAAGGRPHGELAIHPDALEERSRRPRRSGRSARGGRSGHARAARRRGPGCSAGDTIVAIGGRAGHASGTICSRCCRPAPAQPLTVERARQGQRRALRTHSREAETIERSRRQEPEGGPDRRARGRSTSAREPLAFGQASGRGRPRHGRGRRPRSCGRCGGSSAGGSRTGRSAARS